VPLADPHEFLQNYRYRQNGHITSICAYSAPRLGALVRGCGGLPTGARARLRHLRDVTVVVSKGRRDDEPKQSKILVTNGSICHQSKTLRWR
jgi:hypothetical protein